MARDLVAELERRDATVAEQVGLEGTILQIAADEIRRLRGLIGRFVEEDEKARTIVGYRNRKSYQDAVAALRHEAVAVLRQEEAR